MRPVKAEDKLEESAIGDQRTADSTKQFPANSFSNKDPTDLKPES